MVDIVNPQPLDAGFASFLSERKAGFVRSETAVTQHGMAWIPNTDWVGWPTAIANDEPVIETYVATAEGVMAMSDNEPYVSAWQPAVDWMNATVRRALGDSGVELDGDAYITASITNTELLEGVAHMDDDTFVPNDSVGVVAIIGEHVGPRVATHPVDHAAVRPMSQIVFDEAVLEAFAADSIAHCRSNADQLVVFPQFGQLHAGPAAAHLATPTRQLLVFRARTKPGKQESANPLDYSRTATTNPTTSRVSSPRRETR